MREFPTNGRKMKIVSTWPVRLAASFCIGIFLLSLRGQVQSLKNVIASLLMCFPYILIVIVWGWRPDIVIGFSLITGIVGAVLVRLVIGLSHHGMGSAAPSSPDYFSYLSYANVCLSFLSIGNWLSKQKELEARRVGQGALLGTVCWIVLAMGLMILF
jgi:drug/metabolite transporter (DMT)-like permease